MKNKFLLSLVLAVLCVAAMAYDFKADGVYYTIMTTAANQVEVAPAPSDDPYTGEISIPGTVSNNGKTYYVTKIGEGAFYRSKVKKVTMADKITIICKEAFRESKIEEVYLSEKLEIIEASAFNECVNLYDVDLPNTLISIGDFAFLHSGLSDIEIPGSVDWIGVEAFASCYNFECVNLSSMKLKEIPNGMFRNSGISKVEFSDKVTKIGKDAFYNSSVSTVIFPKSLEVIGERAFGRCKYLYDILLPQGLKKIEKEAFDEDPIMNIDLPASVDTIGFAAFSYTLATNVTFPEGLKVIGERAFYNCNIQDIKFPSSLTRIEAEAFWANKDLKKLTIPKTIEYVGERAFENCKELRTVEIKGTNTHFAADIFEQDGNLSSIIVPVTPPEIEEFTFGTYVVNSLYLIATLYVPEGCTATYKTTDYWKKFKNIQELVYDVCDVNHDGGVNSADVVTIYNRIINGPKD